MQAQGRFHGFVTSACLLTMFAVSMLMLKNPRSSAVDAERITLRDKSGKARIILEVSPAGDARIVLRDGNGGERIRLGSKANGSTGIMIADEGARERIEFMVANGGHSSIHIFGEDGVKQIALSVVKGNTPSMRMLDAGGKERYSLAAFSNGMTAQQIHDRFGEPRIVASVGEADGAPSVAMLDSKGKRRLALLVKRDNTPSIAFVDQNAVYRGRIGLNAHGFPKISLLNSAGKRSVEISSDDDVPWAGFFDHMGMPRVGLGVRTDRSAGVSVYRVNGLESASLGVDKGDSPTVYLLDRGGSVVFEKPDPE